MKNILLFCLVCYYYEIGICQGPFKGKERVFTTSENFYKRKKKPDNVWGIDFYITSISGHYSKRIGKELYIGLEAGILPGVNRVILAGKHFTKENTIWSSDRKYEDLNHHSQLLFGHLFARWRPEKLPLEIDGGFRIASYSREVLFVDWNEINEFYGAFLKPMVRIYKFSVGVRLDVGYMYGEHFEPSPEFVMIVSPVFRFNFK